MEVNSPGEDSSLPFTALSAEASSASIKEFNSIDSEKKYAYVMDTHCKPYRWLYIKMSYIMLHSRKLQETSLPNSHCNGDMF